MKFFLFFVILSATFDVNSQNDSIYKYIVHDKKGNLKVFSNTINSVVFKNQRLISVNSTDSNYCFDAIERTLTILKPKVIQVYIFGKNQYPVIESADTCIKLYNLMPIDTIININIEGLEFYINSKNGYAESLSLFLDDRFIQIQFEYNNKDLYDLNNFYDSLSYKRMAVYYGVNGPRDIHYYSYVDSVGLYLVSKLSNRSNKIKYIYIDNNSPYSYSIHTEYIFIYSWRGKLKIKHKCNRTQIYRSD